MINILYYSQDNEIGLRVSGHAGYAELGKDIVCSAVSALVQTLAAHLEIDSECTKCNMNSGYLCLYSKGERVQYALDMILTGLRLIADEYPSHVSVTRGCTLQDLEDMV